MESSGQVGLMRIFWVEKDLFADLLSWSLWRDDSQD